MAREQLRERRVVEQRDRALRPSAPPVSRRQIQRALLRERAPADRRGRRGATWKFFHTVIRRRTPRRKFDASTASTAALIAPAEVPQMIWNGRADVARQSSESARSTPT